MWMVCITIDIPITHVVKFILKYEGDDRRKQNAGNNQGQTFSSLPPQNVNYALRSIPELVSCVEDHSKNVMQNVYCSGCKRGRRMAQKTNLVAWKRLLQ